MRPLRIPVGVWDWRGSALVLVLLVAPLLAALSLVPEGDVLTTASSARSLLTGTATLVAALFLYLHWRITAARASGWLAALLAAAALPGVALGTLALTEPDVVVRQATWVLLFRVALVAGLLATALVAQRRRWPGDPLVAGLLVGLVVSSARHLVLVRLPALPPDPTPAAIRVTVLAALTVALALAVARLDGLPSWVRSRVALGVVLLGVGSAVGGPTALATGLLGAVLLAGTTAALLHLAIDEEKQAVADLHERLCVVETGLRADRARLHEIDATVAGIASAQQLLDDGLPADHDGALSAMVRAEVERLQRLVGDHAPGRRRTVDLDDVVGQIVLAHLARGRAVSWEPTGLRALGRGDDVAEVVNVLLENAFVHGGAGPVTVRTTSDAGGTGVTVTVTDLGPGVPVELREAVFEWGTTRRGSPGQGIGLAVAAQIAHDLGGGLELLATGPGASFALHLAVAPQEVVAREHVARAS